MKVWLDDIREMPKTFDIHVKTAHEAIELLKTGQVEHISLDHDLGPETAGTGYDVAKFIEEGAAKGTLKPLTSAIHSANTAGRKNMTFALSGAEKFWLEATE